MYVSKISLKQFRSYEDAEFSFDKSLTLITGRNGSGKTNLLEAVYVLLQGTSFRVGDKDMIRTDAEWWRIDGVVGDDTRQVRYQLNHHPAKQLLIHETAKRFMYKDRLPVVLFEPTDLQLVHGSPARRRDTLDTMLSSLSSTYKTTLGKYERALKQRNNALKFPSSNLRDQLFSWDVLLSEYGVIIIEERRKLVAQLNMLLGGYYGEIAGEIQELSMVYRSDFKDHATPSKFIAHLHDKLSLDQLRGTTSVGPHRDDVEFLLRGVDARQSASRGEVRTILLALKLAYAQLLEKSALTKPLILLDDVFSELDDVRQKNLLHLMRDNQIIITHTKTLKHHYEITIP